MKPNDLQIDFMARILRTWARQNEAWLVYCRSFVDGEVYRAPELR